VAAEKISAEPEAAAGRTEVDEGEWAADGCHLLTKKQQQGSVL
jgi:hypothetical protein